MRRRGARSASKRGAADYATTSTDTGHPASQSNGSFALNPNGTLD